MAGARSPSPRKLSAVSPRIIAGMLSDAVAMMWLMNDGNRWMNRILPVPAFATLVAYTNCSSRSDRYLPRTCRAMSVQPVSDRMMEMKK